MTITNEQRYTHEHPCPICGRIGTGPTPHCHGFRADDGSFARCTNKGEAEGAMWDEKSEPPAWVWKRKDDGEHRPWTKNPPFTSAPASSTRRKAHGASGGHSATGAKKTPDTKTHPRETSVRYFPYSDMQRVYRRDYYANGEWDKDIFPEYRDANGVWRTGDGPGPLVFVYRRTTLAAQPDATVVLVEGESTSDALAVCGIVATTWRGGTGRVTKALPQLVDTLTGREVTLWADADATGRKAMQTIAAALIGKAARVRLLDPYADDSKRDAEDWLHENSNITDAVGALNSLLDAAPDWMPPASGGEADAPEDSERPSAHRAGEYVVRDGCIYHRHFTRANGETFTRLANFTASVTGEVVRDDGVMTTGELVIHGIHASGAPFPPARVSLDQFAGMQWPLKAWGMRAIVEAGMGTKDHLRAAIQQLSPDAPRHIEYTHTGWRSVDGEWFYLHAGGAIGATGTHEDIAVALPPALKGICLPTPPDGAALINAVRASLAVFDVAPEIITAPLLASVYRAPLCAIAQADTTVALIGTTGVQKSELAALGMQHYGTDFSRLTLPGSWYSTPNSLERLVFDAKDALCAIDDFKPGGTIQDTARLHQTADRIIRGVGNGASRGRMRADGGLRPDTPPRAFLLITGEETPRGESLGARMAIVDVARGDVRLDALSDAQRHGTAGVFAAAMAGYLRWLAPRLDDLRGTAPADRIALRDAARAHATAHARTPDVVANLAYGWQMWLTFARDIGAITDAEGDALWRRVWDALGAMARRQGDHVAAEEPTRRFFDLLNAALASREAHIADADGQAPEPPEAYGWKVITDVQDGNGGVERCTAIETGKRVGWVEGDDLYLDLNAAHGVAQRMVTTAGGAALPPPLTLSRRLHERKLLRSIEPTRNGYTVRKTIERRRRQVLHLHVGVLSDEPRDHRDHDDQRAGETLPGERVSMGRGHANGHGDEDTPGERDHRRDQQANESGEKGYGGHSGHTPDAPHSATGNEGTAATDSWTPKQVQTWIEYAGKRDELAGVPAAILDFGAVRGVRHRTGEAPAAYVARLRAALYSNAA